MNLYLLKFIKTFNVLFSYFIVFLNFSGLYPGDEGGYTKETGGMPKELAMVATNNMVRTGRVFFLGHSEKQFYYYIEVSCLFFVFTLITKTNKYILSK